MNDYRDIECGFKNVSMEEREGDDHALLKDEDNDLDQLIDKMLEIQAIPSCTTADSSVAHNNVKLEPPCDVFDTGGTIMSNDNSHHFIQTPYMRQYDESQSTERSDGFCGSGYGGSLGGGAYVTPATSTQSQFNSNIYFGGGEEDCRQGGQFEDNRTSHEQSIRSATANQANTPESEQNMLCYFAATGAYYPNPNAGAAYGNFVAWAAPSASSPYGPLPNGGLMSDTPSLHTPSNHMLQGRKVSPDIQRLIGGRGAVTRAHSSPDMIPPGMASTLGAIPQLAHTSPQAAHLSLSHTSSSSALPPNFMASLGHHSWSLEAVSHGGMPFASANSLAGSEPLDDPLSPMSSITSRLSRKNSDQTTPSPSSQPLSPLCTTPGSAFPAITEGMRHSTELLYLSPGSSRGSNGLQGEQKLCIVCGDSAACQHYGVRTCEGCKGFFKRTVQKNAQYVCMGNRDCPIDKRRRNRCQYCRFQKCIQVGMVKEVVRHGSLRGRRGRLPSKTKVQTSDEPLSPPVPLITSLTRAYEMTRTSDTDIESVWMGSEDCISNEKMVSILSDSYDAIRTWADKIPGYSELPMSDQETLINSTFFHVLSFRLAYRSMHLTNEESLVFDGGRVIRVISLPEVWQSWARSVIKESLFFKECLQLDLSSFSCLLVFMLLHPEHLQLENVGMVDQLRSTVVNALKDHCTSCYAAQRKAQYFAKLFSRVGEIQPVASAAQATLISVRKWGIALSPQLQILLHNV